MKTFTLIVLILAGAIGHAQEGALPEQAKSAFQERYPATKIGEWWMENGMYYVDFTLKGNSYTAVFDQDGTWQETAEGISDMDIPASLNAYIRKTFPSGGISYCEKVEAFDRQKYVRVHLLDTGYVSRTIRCDMEGKNIIVQE